MEPLVQPATKNAAAVSKRNASLKRRVDCDVLGDISDLRFLRGLRK